DPIFTRFRQVNERVEFAAAKTRERIDHGNVRLAIEGQNEVRIEIQFRSPVETRLKERLDLFAALARIGDLSRSTTIDPCGWTKTAECSTAVNVGDLKAHRSLSPSRNLAFC